MEFDHTSANQTQRPRCLTVRQIGVPALAGPPKGRPWDARAGDYKKAYGKQFLDQNRQKAILVQNGPKTACRKALF